MPRGPALAEQILLYVKMQGIKYITDITVSKKVWGGPLLKHPIPCMIVLVEPTVPDWGI
jgi:hypothetical protein